MKITWLGQGGLLFKTDGATVIIDPYFSNSVAKTDPKKYRRASVCEDFLKISPDVLIFTHDHLDHYDPETASVYLNGDKPMTVLSPTSVWSKVRACGGAHNYIMFDCGTTVSLPSLRFRAVRAEHSDKYAIGVIIEDMATKRKYYITGDTLYNEAVFRDIPNDIFAVFLPINGVGNNMNMTDGAEFANRIGAKWCVPVHFGMLDDIDPWAFSPENKIIPEIYKEINLLD